MGRSAAVISINSVHTQGYSLAKQVIFPSFTLPAHPDKPYIISENSDLDIVTVKVNRFFFTAGRDSLYIPGLRQETNWQAFSPGVIRNLALIRSALWYLQEPTLDILILGLPIRMIHRYQKSLNKRLLGEHWLPHFFHRMGYPLHNRSRVEVRQAIVMPRPVIALFAAASEHSIVTESDSLVLDFNLDTLDILCASKMRPINGQQGCIQGGISGFIEQLARSILQSRKNSNDQFIAQESMLSGSVSCITTLPESAYYRHFYFPSPHLKKAREVINYYLDQAIILLPSMRKMRLAVLTGSGAHLLEPILTTHLPNLKYIIKPLTPERTLLHDFSHSF